MEKGCGQPAWFSQTVNSRLWFCTLKLQAIDSDSVCPPLILQGLNQACLCSHPQMYIHTNSKHCPELAVFFYAVQIRFFTARLQIKTIWKTWPRCQAGSVYTFQTITHRGEHQKEATVIYMLFLVLDFKVHCRKAVWKMKPSQLLLGPSAGRNTLYPVENMFLFKKRIVLHHFRTNLTWWCIS